VPHQGSSTGIEKKMMYREVFSKSIFLFHNAQCRNLTEFMLDGTVYGLHVALLPYTQQHTPRTRTRTGHLLLRHESLKAKPRSTRLCRRCIDQCRCQFRLHKSLHSKYTPALVFLQE
jgi:hypothetical protein